MKLRQTIDKKISSSVGGQIAVFAVVFVATLLITAFLYWLFGLGYNYVDSVAKSFADFFSSDQYSNYAYSNTALSATSHWIKWVTLLSCIVGSVVFQGLLIATLTNAIQNRAEKVRSGDVRYKFKNHILILGYNESVPTLVSRMSKEGCDIVVVVSKEVPDCRNAISDKIGDRRNVVVLRGDRNSGEDLTSLHVSKATQVYILGEESEPNHDLQNIDCYHTITSTIKAEVDCFVQIHEQAIHDRVIHSGETNIQYFHPFNLEEIWARKVLVDTDNAYCKIDYRSAEDNISSMPNKYVHYVIIGFSAMGEAMCREAALLMHYPNYVERGVKSKITCVDQRMRQKMQSFIGRHKTLFDCSGYSFYSVDATGNMTEKSVITGNDSKLLDIEFEFVETDPQNMAFLQQLEAWSNDDNQFLSIAICGDDDAYNNQLGYTLPQSVYMKEVPVFLYQKKMYLSRVGHPMYNSVQAFGYDDVDISTDSEEIRWGKYVNYIYHQLYGNDAVASGAEMRADAEELWNSLSIDKRWSNIYNASSLWYKLRGIGIENIQQLASKQDVVHDKVEVLSEVEHNRWNVEQLIHGYRPTTPSEHQEIVKNPSMKKVYKQNYIHDDIRSYSELDEYTKDKDRQLIKFLLESINYK